MADGWAVLVAEVFASEAYLESTQMPLLHDFSSKPEDLVKLLVLFGAGSHIEVYSRLHKNSSC